MSGIKEKIGVGANFALAMKEALGLTWHQDKEKRHLWKKVGISIAGEYQERKLFKEEVADSVKTDSIKVLSDEGFGHHGRDESVALVPDLEKFVKELLDKLDQEGKLTWHDNGIPEDDIWVKVRGDHGRGSLKVCCQVANTETPNSYENRHIIAMVSVKDNYDVLNKNFSKAAEGDAVS